MCHGIAMNRSSKIFLTIIIAVLVVGGISLFALNNKTDSNSSSDALTPEQSITHGHGLAIDVNDPSKLYIATHAGLFVLINDKDLFRIGKSTDDYMGFSPHPTDANILFSSGHPSNGGNIGFQKSDDGGFTWTKVSDGENGPVDFHAMAISPVNPNLIYGWYQGGLQRSPDQGDNWEIVNRDISPISLVADSRDENILYAATATGQGVLISRDKGVTWTPLSPALEGGAVSVVAVDPTDPKTLLAFSQVLGGLGKTTDAGKTWKKNGEGFHGEVVIYIAFSKANPNLVYALTFGNRLYKSLNSGDTWSQIR